MSYSQYRLDGAILQALKKNKEESPNPTQRQLLKAMGSGGDLLVSAPLKENAERAALIFSLNRCVKEASWTGTKILILTTDQKRVEKALKWSSAFIPGLDQLTIDAFEAHDADGAETANLSKISKGSTLLIATPEAIVPLLEKQEIVFRGLKSFIIENGAKFSDLSLVERIMPRLMGGVQTIVQLSRPTETILNKYREMLGDAELIEAKAEATSEKKSSGSSKTKHSESKTKSEKSDSPHVKRSTLGATKVVSKESNVEEVKEKTPESESKEVRKTPLESRKKEVSEKTSELEATEETLSIAEVMESLKGVTFKTLSILDQTQIEAFVKLIEQANEKKTLGYVIGSFEADTLFKDLRNQDVKLVSVHSKLRRNTYEYRLSRFFSGELPLAIVGGNLKTSERAKGVDQVIFSNPPKSSEQFFRKLSRIEFSENDPEVLILVQQSQESEFLKWAVQTELKFIPLDATAYQDLKPAGRAPKERKDVGSQSGGRGQQKNQSTSNQRGSDRTPSNGRVQSDVSSQKDRSKGKGQNRPDRNRDQRGKSSKGKSYQGGQSRGERSNSGRDERGYSSRGGRNSSGNKARQDRGKGQKLRGEPKKSTPYGLPAASYDRLERGRSGKKESTGLFGAIKKLFGGD